MRYRLDFSDVNENNLIQVMDHNRKRGNKPVLVLKQNIVTSLRQGDIVTLTKSQFFMLVDCLESYDIEYIDHDINDLWSGIRSSCREYPDLHKYIEERWMEVY